LHRALGKCYKVEKLMFKERPKLSSLSAIAFVVALALAAFAGGCGGDDSGTGDSGSVASSNDGGGSGSGDGQGSGANVGEEGGTDSSGGGAGEAGGGEGNGPDGGTAGAGSGANGSGSLGAGSSRGGAKKNRSGGGGEGGSGIPAGSPKEEFMFAADKICTEWGKKISAEATKSIQSGDLNGSKKEVAKAVDDLLAGLDQTVIPNLEAEMDELRALPVPSNGVEAQGAVLTAVQELIDIVEANPEVVLNGEGLEGPKQLAEENGFRACGQLVPA
jgi:hypothetical protein